MLKFFRRKAVPKAAPEAPEAAPAALDEPAEEPAATAAPPVAATAAATAPGEPEAAAGGWRARLGGSALARGVGALFARHPPLDEALLEELETLLITADVGVRTTTEVCDVLRERMHKREFADAAALRTALRSLLLERLRGLEKPLVIDADGPFVVLVVGINGAGKTTTIGKLARHARREGLSVLLSAGDTFRAAAVEQLQAWGERNDIAVIAQGQGADAASVSYDAYAAARARGVDLLLADTAGRLHTQGGLMAELGKIARVLKKIDPAAPHETLLVLDGGTGQNAISQVRTFREMVDVTGLVVTKLDGTAKGGVVFALASEFGLPIRFVGLGEGIDDLRVFDAERYVDGLLPDAG